MHLNAIRFAHRYRYLYDTFQGLSTKASSLSHELQFLIDRINFAARDKIASPLSNRLTSILNLKRMKEKKNVDYFLSYFSRIFFLSRVAAYEWHWCIAVIVGVFVAVVASLTQIPNRLFFPPAYSRFFISAFVVRARLSLPRASPSADSARSFALSFPFSARAHLFLSFASPPLPRIPSQILTYDYGQANVWISARTSEWRSGPLKMSDVNIMSYFNIRFSLISL